MKAKIALAVSALLIGTITTANADLYIESARGITQEQWNATDSYKNFSCPSGYMRGDGMDMNFTSSRADDFYYVNCSPIIVYTPRPIETIEPTPAQTDTSTATVVSNTTAPQNNNTATVTTETATVVTETTTATATSTSTTFESLYAQIMALLTQILALIAKLQG
jgi:spore germination protein YaaH